MSAFRRHPPRVSIPVLCLALLPLLAAPVTRAADGKAKVGDAFKISGGGVVVTGVVTEGTLAVGDPVCVPTSGGDVASRIEAMESFNKVIESAEAGTHVGLLVPGIDPDEVDTDDGVLTVGCGE